MARFKLLGGTQAQGLAVWAPHLPHPTLTPVPSLSSDLVAVDTVELSFFKYFLLLASMVSLLRLFCWLLLCSLIYTTWWCVPQGPVLDELTSSLMSLCAGESKILTIIPGYHA